MNNRVTITFSRNFVAGDSIGVYYSDPSTQTSGYWTFTWVSGTPGTFQVQIGTPTTTTGEIEAIRFASAWTNSLNGFTVTQPVGGNDNQVQITSQTYHFVNVLAKFSDGSTMAIPTDYSYVLSTVSTGNKITYTDKEPLNTPTAPAINLWKADDANEVKTKHNLNDDRIGTNETDIAANTAAIAGKADLVGGNNFTGDQTIDGKLIINEDSFDTLRLKRTVSGSTTIIMEDSNQNGAHIQSRSTGGLNLSTFINNINTNALSIDQNQNIGIGIQNPTEKLDIRGSVKIGKVGVSPYLTFDENPDISSGSEFYLTHDIDGNILKFTDDNSNNLISMDRDNGNVGVGTTTPSEKLEVKGRIYINPDVQTIGGEQASAIMFKSKNAPGTATAQARIYSYNAIQGEGFMDFQVEKSSGSFDTGLRLSTASGKVSAIVPTDLQIAEVISLTGGARAYSDLPSSPTVGTISYINDASSVSYRGTAAGGGSDVALVFYDGSNWLYH